MSPRLRLQSLLGTTAAQRRTRFGVLIAAVILVPLAVAGLVAGALGGADQRLETIPAIVVNNDEMVTMTGADGADQPVLAGRQLVTELTGPETAGFSWTISNDEEAEQALARGDAYAVLTIPADFSASIVSISGESPKQADLSIRTDDAHGFLAGAVAQSVGQAMTATFGQQLTAQYLEGFYANLAGMGGSLGQAADGATQLSSGAGSLAGGLTQLSSGVAQAATGASDAAGGAWAYADGVRRYTEGVDGISAGLGDLGTGAAGLDQISDSWDAYTGGIAQGVQTVDGYLGPASEQLSEVLANNPELLEQFPELAGVSATIEGVRTQLGGMAAGGQQLAAASRGAIDGVQDGIAGLAGGAAQLAAGSAGLRDGANSLASGVDGLATGLGQLSSGASDAASGATELAGGATQLADGLAKGAEDASALSGIDAAKTADVVSQPVTIDAARNHEIASSGEVIGMLFAPIGLWVGALALFLVLRPFPRDALRSTTSTAGLVGRALWRTGLIALAQAAAIVALLHTALGVSWTLLPQTLAFSTLLALVFTALHGFLQTALGRAGTLVSLVLVALQLASTGGLYPVEVLSGPFQAISRLLPLTWAVEGMQGIVAGAASGQVAGAAGVLALFGLGAVVATAAVVARRRGIRSTGFAAAAIG